MIQMHRKRRFVLIGCWILAVHTWTVWCNGGGNVALGGEPTGRWVGNWQSLSSGHRGAMRATIEPSVSGTYQARFTGRFFIVIPFAYRATLTPVAEHADGSTTLVSRKKLGPILGQYTMTARLQGDRIDGQFQAGRDRGRIALRRR
jgi:hypothetical protein